MTKFTKLTVCAVVALLVICLSSTTFASIVARQDLPSDLPSGLPSDLPLPTGTPSPSGPASPTDAPDGGTPTPSAPVAPAPDASGVPSAPSGPDAYPSAPTPNASASAAFSSLLGKYATPTDSGTPPPYVPAPTGKSASGDAKTPSGASKIENGLISGVIIAGIVSLFF